MDWRTGGIKKISCYIHSRPSLLKGPGDVLRWPLTDCLWYIVQPPSSLRWHRAGAARRRLDLRIWRLSDGRVCYNWVLYGPYASPLMEHVGSIFSIRFVTAMQILLHQFNHSLSLVLAPSCPENTALTPPTAASYPNPPTNSPMLQWTSIDSWICTALHCLPSSGFPPRTEPSFFGKVVLHQSPNLFSLSLSLCSASFLAPLPPPFFLFFSPGSAVFFMPQSSASIYRCTGIEAYCLQDWMECKRRSGGVVLWLLNKQGHACCTVDLRYAHYFFLSKVCCP